MCTEFWVRSLVRKFPVEDRKLYRRIELRRRQCNARIEDGHERLRVASNGGFWY